MSLFKCAGCGTKDNTALSPYFWVRKAENKPWLCTSCMGADWHDKFPKVSAEGMYVDARGYVWNDEEQCPAHLRVQIGDGGISVLDEKWRIQQFGVGEDIFTTAFTESGHRVALDIVEEVIEHIIALHNADLERRQNADAVNAGLQAKGLKKHPGCVRGECPDPAECGIHARRALS